MSKSHVFMRLSAAAAALLATACGASDDEANSFRQALPGSKVIVYPAVVRTGGAISHDAAAAQALAAALGKAGAKDVVVSSEQLTLSDKRSFNQGAMYKASQAAFGEYVKSHSPEAEFAAVAEYLKGSDGTVGGIHLYVVRRDGSRAYGWLLNSHHKEYKAVEPRSNEQATTALIARLERGLLP